MTRNNTGYTFNLSPVRLVLLLVVLQLIIALFTYSLTFTHEEAMWHYIGRNWFRNGLVPYEGGVDNKSPLIFAIYGLSDWLFGVNYWFPRITGTLVEAIGIYYIFKIANRLAGNKAGILAISIYGLSLLWKMTGGKLVSFTETYATTLIIISFYKCLTASNNKGYFISGLLAGLGFGFRVSAIFGILAIFITTIRRSFSGTLFFIAGMLTSCLTLIAMAWLAGIDIHAIIQYALTDNFGTGSTTDHDFHWKLESFTSNFFYSELVLFYPFVIAYFFIYKKADTLATWLVCTFTGIIMLGIYADPHFKELLPALSLTAAIALAHITDTYKVPFKPVLIIIWICFFPKVLEPFWGLKKLIVHANMQPETYCAEPGIQADDEAEKQLGLWIRSVTKAHDRVYIAGYGSRVQVYSERLSPTVFFNVTQTNIAKQRLYNDLGQNKPGLMAIPSFTNYTSYVGKDIRGFTDTLAAREYRFHKCMYGYNIYLKDSLHTQPH